MSIMLSASTCDAELEQGEHLFKISDYSVHRGMGVGRNIDSSVFTVGGHGWRLHYYPDGSGEDSKDDIVVHLLLEEMDGSNADTVRVSSAISLFDWKTKQFSSSMATNDTLNLSQNELLPHHINRGDMEVSGRYVVDDRLTIKCAVTVIKVPYVIEEVDELSARYSHVEVPPPDITEQLGKLLETKEAADVTFEVQGEEFPAHKLVLAMRSPVFKARLFGPMREKDANRVVIDDMQPAVFRVLLHFVYSDSLPVAADQYGMERLKLMDDLDTKEMTRHLLVAADHYGMERLKLMCESILSKGLDVDSVATTLALADQHSCSRLKDACTRFIASCTKLNDVVTSEGYNRLKRSCPDTVIEMWEMASKLRQN